MQVEGSVEFDGAPADSGSISFEPADGQGRDFGGLIVDGKYKIESPPGVVPGLRIVRITAMRKTGRQIPAGPPAPAGTMIDETIAAPRKYHEKSDFTARVQAGEINRFDFKLQSDSPPP